MRPAVTSAPPHPLSSPTASAPPSVPDTLLLEGIPAGKSNQKELLLKLKANPQSEETRESPTHYSHALLTGESDCTQAEFSEWKKLEEPLELETGVDGLKTLCLRTRSDAPAGVEGHQAFLWIQDTMPPVAIVASPPFPVSDTSVLSTAITGHDLERYRFALLPDQGSAETCASATYSEWRSAETPLVASLGEDGPKTLCVVGHDDAGNIQSAAAATTHIWTKVTRVPTPPPVQPRVAELKLEGVPTGNSNQRLLTLRGTVNGGETETRKNPTHYAFALLTDGSDCSSANFSQWKPLTEPHILTTGLDGMKLLCLHTRSEALAGIEGEQTFVWLQDTAAPEAIIADPPAQVSNVMVLSTRITGTDVERYRFALLVDRGNADACTNATYSDWRSVTVPISASLGEDGPKTLCVVGVDKTGNTQLPQNATVHVWVKNTRMAVVTVVPFGLPEVRSRSAALSLMVGGSNVALFRYRLLHETVASCSPFIISYPQEWTSVDVPISEGLGADGPKTICIVGRDALGLQTSQPVSYSWTKDTGAPTALLDGVPEQGRDSSLKNLVVSVSGSEVVSYQFSFQDGTKECAGLSYSDWLPVAMPLPLGSFQNGPKTLCVRARDLAGNEQEIPTRRTWNYAETLVTLGGLPSSPSNAGALNVSLSGSRVAWYRYNRNHLGDTATDCSNATFSEWLPLSENPNIQDAITGGDGIRVLCVQAKSEDGVLQERPALFAWTRDATAPEARILGVPASPSMAETIDAAIGGEGLVKYKFLLLFGNGTGCPSPDALGYSEWKDAAIPLVSSLSQGLGRYLLCVVGRDAAGNTQTEATAYSWIRDSSLPFAILNVVPPLLTNTPGLNLNVAGPGLTAFNYALLGPSSTQSCATATYQVSFSDIASRPELSFTSDGDYRLCLLGKSAAGTEQARENATAYSWRFDGTPPRLRLDSLPTPLDATLDVVVGGDSDLTMYRSQLLDGQVDCPAAGHAGYSPPSSTANRITGPIGADGPKTLCVVGIDAAGNLTDPSEPGATGRSTWVKATSNIDVRIVSGGPANLTSSTLVLLTTASMESDEQRYTVVLGASTPCPATNNDSAWSAWRPIGEPISTEIVTGDGDYRLCIMGRVSATGTLQILPTTYTWRLDTTPPLTPVTIAEAPVGKTNQPALNAKVNTASDATKYKYKIISGASADCGGMEPYSEPRDFSQRIVETLAVSDVKKLCAVGIDAAGNVQTPASLVSWTLDLIKPVAAFAGAALPAAGAFSNATSLAGISVSGATGHADVIQYKYKLVSTAAACTDATGYSVWIDKATQLPALIISGVGTKALCALAKDDAGNEQELASASARQWTFDNVAPTLASITVRDVTSGSTAVTNSANVNVSLETSDATAYCVKQDTVTPAYNNACFTASNPRSHTLNLTGVTAGESVTLHAWAKDSAGNISNAQSASIVYSPVATDASFAGIASATAQPHGRYVQVSWIPVSSSENFDEYHIYFQPPGGAWTHLTSVAGSGESSAFVTLPADGTTYNFKVTASNGFQEIPATQTPRSALTLGAIAIPATATENHAVFSSQAPNIIGYHSFTRANVMKDALVTFAGQYKGAYLSTYAYKDGHLRGEDYGLAWSANMRSPGGLAFKGDTAVFVVDTDHHRILQFNATTGKFAVIAGTGAAGYSGDGGAATQARLYYPTFLAYDAANDKLYVADSGNNRIRVITLSNGNISLVAGNGTSGTPIAGVALGTPLNFPAGMALSPDSSALYYSDSLYHCIRKIVVATGQASTYAGTCTTTPANTGDGGAATAARFNNPQGLAMDSTYLYVADSGNKRIRRIRLSDGIALHFSGAATGTAGCAEGTTGASSTATYSEPVGISLAGGVLYVADAGCHKIRRASDGETTVARAGSGTRGYNHDGAATTVQLDSPSQVVAVSDTAILFLDTGNHRLRKYLSPNVVTLGGSGAAGYNCGGFASYCVNAPDSGSYEPHQTKLLSPRGMVMDISGNIYVADALNHRVRKYTRQADGSYRVSTVAGTGTAGNSGDGGAASAATLNTPTDVAIDGSGNIFIVDQGNHRIRFISPSNGFMNAFAGDSSRGFYHYSHGCGTYARFNSPSGIDVDEKGNVYVADTGNNLVRRFSVSTPGTCTGGVLLVGLHALANPKAAASFETSNAGFDRAGTIPTSDGDGQFQSALGTMTRLNAPRDVRVTPDGSTLFIADSNNHRVRRVDLSNGFDEVCSSLANCWISTVAGVGVAGFGGDEGLARDALLDTPASLELDRNGNLFIADSNNQRIRMVRATDGTIITIAGNGLAGFSGDGRLGTEARLFLPQGLLLDTRGNLYISDEMDHVRVLKRSWRFR